MRACTSGFGWRYHLFIPRQKYKGLPHEKVADPGSTVVTTLTMQGTLEGRLRTGTSTAGRLGQRTRSSSKNSRDYKRAKRKRT